MIQDFISRFLVEIVATLIGFVIFMLLTLVQRSARPNVRFHVYGDEHVRRFLLRNLDPVVIPGPLKIVVDAWGCIAENGTRMSAGPYAKRNVAVLSEDRRQAIFELNSFPADGSVMVVVVTESPDVRLDLAVSSVDDEGGGQTLVRGGTIEAPTRWYHRGGALLRWFLGLSIGLLTLAWGYATFFRDQFDWRKDWRMDSYMFIVLVVASLMTYFTIVQPMTHEEMIAGYLGQSDIRRTGQSSAGRGGEGAPPDAGRVTGGPETPEKPSS